MTTTTPHNHDLRPFSPLEAPGACPRCDERRAERSADGLVDHNHPPLPFGRRKPRDECPRCDQLHDGATPRLSHAQRQRREDARRCEEIRAHAPVCNCGPVCTFGQW
ncbi:hypothetical protein ACFFMN_23290 [Planobispora siamensis]|uniref:Uncharacterized protein n=1 Tax=Planobispora siamensis TaxID=936338 RepID=A0A8J3SJ75_9ACTN|nr:hypothetical protein [Planobispora siamensis]GIH95287.1 hypothetical protein Psi01_59170 [Planobispora siamensis]